MVPWESVLAGSKPCVQLPVQWKQTLGTVKSLHTTDAPFTVSSFTPWLVATSSFPGDTVPLGQHLLSLLPTPGFQGYHSPKDTASNGTLQKCLDILEPLPTGTGSVSPPPTDITSLGRFSESPFSLCSAFSMQRRGED